MKHLQDEHGDDLVFAELHLDEDTPHLHVVVAPTYLKRPRKPGRQKRGETLEEFEERKAAALSSVGVRTVGRASHATLSKPGSFQTLRSNMTNAVEHLGIVYGEDRSIDAPPGKTTREWVKEQAEQLRKDRSLLAKEKIAHESKKAELKKKAEKIDEAVKIVSQETIKQDKRQADLDRREQLLRKNIERFGRLAGAIGERLGVKIGVTFRDALRSIELALEPRRSSETTVIEQMDKARQKISTKPLISNKNPETDGSGPSL